MPLHIPTPNPSRSSWAAYIVPLSPLCRVYLYHHTRLHSNHGVYRFVDSACRLMIVPPINSRKFGIIIPDYMQVRD